MPRPTPHRPARVRRSRTRRRRIVLLAFAQLAAAVAVIVGFQGTAQAGPEPVMEGYVPLPADQLVSTFEGIRSGAGTTLDFTVGITNAGSGAILTYDHWEDGYEADLANPTQGSTLVFGDVSAANGNAASWCAVCAGDLLPSGAPLIMRNSVSTPRPTTNPGITFDGRDKVGSTRGFAITAGGFTTTRGSLQAAVVSAYDTTKYATAYTVPVGTDTPVPSGASNPFGYTATFVQASANDTVVEVDRDADGTVDVTQTLAEGRVLLTTGIREGATVKASKPVQVHLMTGDTSAQYEARSFTLFPDVVLASDYLSPAGSSDPNFATNNFLYNPTSAPITVTPTCVGCSGTITVPAHASATFRSPAGRGVRFASTGGERFIAIAGVGAHSGSEASGATDRSSQWDWGFTMIPTSQLTSQVVLGWAPGNSNNPPSSPAGNRDDGPVWVTTMSATTVRVDFDGNPATGAIATADCFGRHDLELPVAALASTRIFDSADGDMTGSRIYTCDETLIAGAWGEDPQTAPIGAPGFDAGYTIIPSTTMVLDKRAAIATDANGDGRYSPGDTVTYSVSIADAGNLAFTDVELTDVLQPGMTYVPGSTTIDDGATVSAYPDDVVPPAATPFPFDEGGNALPMIEPGQTVVVSFDVTLDSPAITDDGTISNTACVAAQEASGCATSLEELTEADLELTKSLEGNPQRIGDEATFLIEVDNLGPDAASLVEVTDLLPSGTTYVSSDPSQGSYDHQSGVWTVGTIESGGSAQLRVVATIDQLSVTNVAEVTSAAAWDPDSTPGEGPLDEQSPPDEDDEDAVTVTVSPALIDLSLTKELSEVGAKVGDEATFEVTVTNAGPSAATGVAVSDQLPTGLTHLASTGSQGTYDASTGAWAVGSLGVGASATLTIEVRVDTDEEITNTAQVSAAEQGDADSTPGNDDPGEDDQASATLQVDPLIDLEVAKELIEAPTYLGQDATFRVTVTNRGPSDATAVEVTDHLGDDLTFVATDQPGAFSPATGTWSVGDLAAGASTSIEITARVDALATANFAEVTAAGELDVDSQPAEGPLGPLFPADQDDEGAATVTVAPLADLSLTKELTATPTFLGDDATFEVTVTNDGPSPATGVEVTDQLPTGLTYASATTTQGTYDEATGTWAVGTLAPGASATLRIEVEVEVLSALNLAQVTAVNEDDPDSQPAEGPLDEQSPPDQDDEDGALVQVAPRIDLSVTKDVTVDPTHVGDETAFEITVTNAGPSIATGVVVADVLPAGLELQSTTASHGTYDEATGEWTVGTLDPGASATLGVSTEATDAGELTNVAQVTAADQEDRDSTPGNDDPSEDDQDDATVTVAELIDLSLAKEVTIAPSYLGQPATFRLTVTNDGPSDATGVEVTDLLPAGATFVASTAGPAYDPATGTWTIGSLAAGASTSMDLDVIVDALQVANLAEVSAADQDDVDSQPAEGPLDAANPPDQDDEDLASLSVAPLADLSLAKVETDSPRYIGDRASFTITVRNDGPSPATGVEVTDRLPTGLTYVSHDADPGTYDPESGVWSIGDLDVDASATLTIVATVWSGEVRNLAEVTAADQDDPDSQPAEGPLDEQSPPDQDDEDGVLAQVDPLIDLSVDKQVTDVGTSVGDDVTFEVTVANAGPSTATGVVVADRLPAGLDLVDAQPSQGTYDPATGAWSVGSLAVDASATLTVTATVTSDEEIVNVAQVAAADQDDRDSTPANDDASEDDQDDAAVDVDPLIDLSLTKSLVAAPTYLGDEATFRITVRNDGPSPATGVEVTDLLPTGLRFVSASLGDDYDADTGVWTIGSLGVGDSRALDLTVVVDRLTATNRAEVNAADQDDTDSAPAENPLDATSPPDQDDEDLAPVTVAPVADLSLTKSSSPSTVEQLDDATFTIVVRNDGPSAATGVQVADQLPGGVALLSADASQGSYDPTTGTWDVGTLGVDDEATLTIEVNVTGTGDITNTAQVIAVGEHDPDSTPGNDDPSEDDQDRTTLSSTPLIDLSVDKAVSAPRADVGAEATYTVTVANDGPSAATGVVVGEELPDGVAHVRHEASAGTWSPASGRWDVGDLEVGATATLEITVEVLEPGIATNVAQVIEADQRDVDSQPDEDPLGPTDPPNQDDEATVDVFGVLVDLELEIAADATTVGVGSPVTCTVTLTNQGPSDATGVTVDALLPSGASYVEATPSVGSYDPATEIWTVGDLPVGETVTLQIEVTITEAGPIIMVSQVEAADQPDVDSTPSNDDATEDDQDEVVVVGELADLALAKAVSDPAPPLGSEVTYTLTVTNDGPSDATGVTVSDPLPEGLSYVSHDGGTYDPSTGRWEVGTVPAGGSAELSIAVRVLAIGTTTNQAWVAEADQPDPDSQPGPPTGQDDEGQVDLTPIPARLEGELWLDRDGDGSPGEGEPPMQGVTILLRDAQGDVIATAVTDADGQYRFEDLMPGAYTVEVDQATLPSTVAGQTYDPDDVADSFHQVTLEAGENRVDIDFGYQPVQEVAPPPPPAPAPPAPVPPAVDRGTLPRTGAGIATLVALALALLGAGALVLRSRRWSGASR